jgi:transcriptional regulator with XRE-family HTH domain
MLPGENREIFTLTLAKVSKWEYLLRMKETKGSVALCGKLAERGAQQALAKELGVPASLILSWRSGRQSPLTKSRLALLDHLGIPIESWDEVVTEEELQQPAEAS